MPSIKSSTPVVPISAALKSSTSTRSIPYNPETARCLGGGARGRTLAIIYRQLAYWSKYAKWKGSGGRKFFYKSQKELAGELGYSEKTISRAIKALRELGLIIVEKLHKTYWRQVFFYYLPQSPYRSTEPPAPAGVAVEPQQAAVVATTPTNGASAGAGGSVDAFGAAAATATSIRARGGGGFRQNVRIQQREYKPQSNKTLQAVVERCYEIAAGMKRAELNEGICV
jgi:biotin operon repressor